MLMKTKISLKGLATKQIDSQIVSLNANLEKNILRISQ
jgi:hypothetical protein